MITFIDLFCGIGGFRKGIEDAAKELNLPVKCVFSSEIEKNAIKVYNNNFGEIPSGDITKIETRDIADMDILCGGFPCQAFSVAGKRKGFEDTRGTLFFEIARIAKDKRPKILFLENVKGLLNHDRGRTFGTILITLDELGYDVEWQVLNSKDFGVPQNRERVFIIGHLRGSGTRQIFPIFGETRATTRENSSTCTDANYWKGIDNHGQRTAIMYTALTERRTEEAKTIRKESMKKGIDWSPRRSKELIPRTDGVSNCLTATFSYEHLLYSEQVIRKLTPVECERLQGYPDNWTAGISDSARYKCLGNSVTVNVIKEIVLKILTCGI